MQASSVTPVLPSLSAILEIRRGVIPEGALGQAPGAFLFAEVWPSWLGALTPLTGFQPLVLYCTSLDYQRFWAQHDIEWVLLPTSLTPLPVCPPPTTLVVSGSHTFCEWIWAHYHATPGPARIHIAMDLMQIPDPPFTAPDRLTWSCLEHSQFGGLTTGRWWLGSNVDNLSIRALPPQASQRRIRHILSPMTKGRPHPPPAQPDAIYNNTVLREGHLHHGGYISPLDMRKCCLCPAVFSHTGWASRFLTAQELA
jgi:hypothetical protein